MRILILLLNLLKLVSNISWYKNFGMDINNPDCVSQGQPIMEYYKIDECQYMFFSERVSWDEARVICPNYDARLAMVDTPAKAYKLAAAIAESNIEMEDIWIGGKRTDTGTWIWLDNQLIPFESLDGFPPWVRKPDRPWKQCVAMDRLNVDSPLFVDLDCHLLKPFMCQKDIDGPVNSDVILPSHMVTAGKNTYIFFHSRVCWTAAVAFCRMRGYRLAIIPDNKVAKIISKAMVRSRPSFENMWISGYFSHNKWRWLSSGEIIQNDSDEDNYPPWHYNSTNHTSGCVLFDRHLCANPVFLASKCDRKRDFICEKYPQIQKHRVKVGPVRIVYRNWTMFLILKDLSWYEAQEYCHSQNAYLTEIYDYEMMRAITTAMSDQQSEPLHVWLGGMMIDYTWIWTTTNTSIPTTTDDTGFVPWCNVEDDAENEDDSMCLNMDREAHDKPVVYGLNCNTGQPFVCTSDTSIDASNNTECKQAPIIASTHGKIYVTFFTPVTFSTAKLTCTKAGGDLAKVKNNELKPLVTYLQKNVIDCAERHLWIETSKNCAYIRYDVSKSLHSKSCDSLKGYICEIFCNRTLPISSPFSKNMWNCPDKRSEICKTLSTCQVAAATTTPATTFVTTTPTKTTTVIITTPTTVIVTTPTTVIVTTPITTNRPKTITTSASIAKQTCKQSRIPLQHQTTTSIIFLTRYSYKDASNQCVKAGGKVANIKEMNIDEIANSILHIEDKTCTGINFWVMGDGACSELDIEHRVVRAASNCMEQQGFICDIFCSVPQSVDEFNQTVWICEKENYLSCKVQCKEESVLIGSDTIVCTNVGWVTNLNKTTYLPSCQNYNTAADDVSSNIDPGLDGEYNGILFVLDESFSITTSEWWLQLQFVASIIQLFPLSPDFPMGLILFTSNVNVPIPYNATDTCEVLEILRGLKPGVDREFTSYKEALEEADKQIKQLHDDLPTIIFFISDGDQNGDEFNDILEDLKQRHLFISVGISTEPLDDLNVVASMRNDKLMMYKFDEFKSLQIFTSNLMKHRSTTLTCREDLYNLPIEDNEQELTEMQKSVTPICEHSATLLPHQITTFVIFFTPRSSRSAVEQCSNMNGQIINITSEVANAVSKTVDSNCAGTNFWVKENVGCRELDVKTKAVQIAKDCTKEQGFICEIFCGTSQLPGAFNQTVWKCKEAQNRLTCEVECQDEEILVGADYFTCTNSGWMTNFNETTDLPSCKDNPTTVDHIMKTVPMDDSFNGLLFIVDESYSLTVPEWWLQLQFIASIIQLFPISAKLPMGLILFSTTVYVPIPYNETDTCKVLEIIRGLRPSEDRSFTFYEQALVEADKQIKEFQGNQPTIIFFISDGDSNGSNYTNILRELKKKHLIISIGINSASLSDLNEVASIKDNKLMMYKFRKFGSFQKFVVNLMAFRSMTLQCEEYLYVLPNGTNESQIQKRMYIPLNEFSCNDQSPPIEVNGISYTIFYNKLTYLQAKHHCKSLGSRLASQKVNELEAIANLSKICKDTMTEFWIYKKEIPCASLQMDHEIIENESAEVCSKELGFICESGCSNHPNNTINNSWTCFYQESVQKCYEECKNDAVMVGTTTFICSSINGWVTLNNYTTNFPICLVGKDFENEFVGQISKLKKEHHGFLFVFDISLYQSREMVTLNQLVFMETLLDVFPPSKYFPVGLILFDEDASIQMSYVETSFCTVLAKLQYLKNGTAILKSGRRLSYYDKALVTVAQEIEIMQPRRKTVIFFISDHINNGDEYMDTVINLKKNHTIFSIGNGYSGLKDLNMIASVISDNALMYTFKSYKHLADTMTVIKKYHGKQHKCADF